MRPDRGQTLANAPLEDLLSILLRQFRRPLSAHGVKFTDADAARLAGHIAARNAGEPLQEAIRNILAALIAESETVLQRWNLTFEQALKTPMDQIPGWESTAEFLEIANEKTNAELRIAAGAALLTAMGDPQHADKVLTQIAYDPDETEAQIGKRLLSFAAGIDASAPDWVAQAQRWAAGSSTP